MPELQASNLNYLIVRLLVFNSPSPFFGNILVFVKPYRPNPNLFYSIPDQSYIIPHATEQGDMKEPPAGALPKGSGYKHSSDFVAYFLSSPITKEPEYEIRIKADMQSIDQYKRLLEQKKVEYRLIGLPVFPPPVCLLLEDKSLKDALETLSSWYKDNKSKNPDVSIVKPSGEVVRVEKEQDVQELLLKA